MICSTFSVDKINLLKVPLETDVHKMNGRSFENHLIGEIKAFVLRHES